MVSVLANNMVIPIFYSSLSYLRSEHSKQTLTTLNLDSNSISDKGAKYLADALRNNTVTIILSSFLLYSYIHFFT